MAATKQDIQRWFERGKQLNATHMLVVCDTFDWEDDPVYVSPGEDINTKISRHSGNMQKVMEVYNYSLPIQEQLNQSRSWNV